MKKNSLPHLIIRLQISRFPKEISDLLKRDTKKRILRETRTTLYIASPVLSAEGEFARISTCYKFRKIIGHLAIHVPRSQYQYYVTSAAVFYSANVSEFQQYLKILRLQHFSTHMELPELTDLTELPPKSN